MTQSPGSKDFTASCMGGKGWPLAKGTITDTANDQQPQGAASLRGTHPNCAH